MVHIFTEFLCKAQNEPDQHEKDRYALIRLFTETKVTHAKLASERKVVNQSPANTPTLRVCRKPLVENYIPYQGSRKKLVAHQDNHAPNDLQHSQHCKSRATISTRCCAALAN